MLEKILKTLKENGYKEIVYTFGIEESIENEEKKYISDNFKINRIKDIRSATFYALGKENLNNKCILIVNGDEIQNILTGITETWFQKLNIFIVALYKRYDDIKTEFLRRVIPNIVNIFEEEYNEYENFIIKATKAHSPTLITIKHSLSVQDYDYNNLILKLKKVIQNDSEIFLYNCNKEILKNDFKIKNISYKYCILSKYMGYIVGRKKKTLICIPEELLLLDLNILNNRYLDKNFKVIVFDFKEENYERQIKDWCNSNNIKTVESDKITVNQLDEFWKDEEPTILLLKGEI